MKKIIVFGTGLNSRVVLNEIENLKEYKFIGFIDDIFKKQLFTLSNKKTSYLGKISDLNKYFDNNTYGIISWGDNFKRKEIVKNVYSICKKFKWASVVSKKSIISKKVNIGEGTLIMPGTVINFNSNIGRHCIINTNSTIEHDNRFDDYSACGPGVTTSGNVTVGELSYLGVGSSIMHGVAILKNTVIGGQSYVNKDCASDSVYYGVPAKKIRKRTVGEKYL
jgi:sugar O-acyltransferase (sialic acid O-acetyltransferase NeuD family)